MQASVRNMKDGTVTSSVREPGTLEFRNLVIPWVSLGVSPRARAGPSTSENARMNLFLLSLRYSQVFYSLGVSYPHLKRATCQRRISLPIPLLISSRDTPQRETRTVLIRASDHCIAHLIHETIRESFPRDLKWGTGEDLGKKELWLIGGNTNWCSHCRK